MPVAPLSQAQVEQLWARDRAALVKCGLSLEAIVAFYQELDTRLAGANLRK